MGVYLEKTKEPLEIPKAFDAVIGAEGFEALRFMDDAVYDDEAKGYNTYKLVTKNGVFVLKKSADEESFSDEVKHYGLLKGLPVPKLLGAAEGFLLMGFVEGNDLKRPDDNGVKAAAESLAAIMNAHPMGRDCERGRYERYLKRLEKRAALISGDDELSAAFRVFYERQKEIPLTLSNADLLPLNVLYDGERAVIIDWEFGGFMPYALDIARFTAHGLAEGAASPFSITQEQKKLFEDTVYGRLTVKPERAVYDRDLTLARFNEYVEILEYYFMEPGAERGATFNWYYPEAKRLAAVISAGI